MKLNLDQLEIGEIQRSEHLTLFPLIGKSHPIGCSTLKHRLSKDDCEVIETKQVSNLLISNKSSKKVLVMLGEVLKGGWQNRVTKKQVLINKDSKEIVPVHCVEARRWSTSGEGTTLYGVHGVIAAGCTFTYCSSSSVDIMYTSNQTETWDNTSAYLYGAKIASTTEDLSEYITKKSKEIKEEVKHFKCVPKQLGVILNYRFSGKEIWILETYCSSGLLRSRLEEIVRSVLLEEIIHQEEKVEGLTVEKFLKMVQNVTYEEIGKIGIGIYFETKNNGLKGALTIYKDNLISVQCSLS